MAQPKPTGGEVVSENPALFHNLIIQPGLYAEVSDRNAFGIGIDADWRAGAKWRIMGSFRQSLLTSNTVEVLGYVPRSADLGVAIILGGSQIDKRINVGSATRVAEGSDRKFKARVSMKELGVTELRLGATYAAQTREQVDFDIKYKGDIYSADKQAIGYQYIGGFIGIGRSMYTRGTVNLNGVGNRAVARRTFIYADLLAAAVLPDPSTQVRFNRVDDIYLNNGEGFHAEPIVDKLPIGARVGVEWLRSRPNVGLGLEGGLRPNIGNNGTALSTALYVQARVTLPLFFEYRPVMINTGKE